MSFSIYIYTLVIGFSLSVKDMRRKPHLQGEWGSLLIRWNFTVSMNFYPTSVLSH